MAAKRFSTTLGRGSLLPADTLITLARERLAFKSSPKTPPLHSH
jgi:hypothetical protein